MVFLTDFQCPQTGHLGVSGDKGNDQVLQICAAPGPYIVQVGCGDCIYFLY